MTDSVHGTFLLSKLRARKQGQFGIRTSRLVKYDLLTAFAVCNFVIQCSDNTLMNSLEWETACCSTHIHADVYPRSTLTTPHHLLRCAEAPSSSQRRMRSDTFYEHIVLFVRTGWKHYRTLIVREEHYQQLFLPIFFSGFLAPMLIFASSFLFGTWAFPATSFLHAASLNILPLFFAVWLFLIFSPCQPAPDV